MAKTQCKSRGLYDSYLLPIGYRSLSGEICAKTTKGLNDVSFWLALCEEIITDDYPELAEQYKLFKQRLDAVFDMRFYASELEMLCGEVGGFERGCPFEINWQKTNRNELWLYFDKKYDLSDSLSIKTQESLSRLVAYLIFDKNIVRAPQNYRIKLAFHPCIFKMWQDIDLFKRKHIVFNIFCKRR